MVANLKNLSNDPDVLELISDNRRIDVVFRGIYITGQHGIRDKAIELIKQKTQE